MGDKWSVRQSGASSTAALLFHLLLMSNKIQRPLFNMMGMVGGSVGLKKHHLIPFLRGNESVWRTAFPLAKEITFSK